MTRRRKPHAAATVLVALTAVAGCDTTPVATPQPQGAARLAVVTSIYPLEMIVRKLGGDRVAASTLLPPGASPHSFEPSPGDVRRIAGAALFVYVGGGLDDWATRLLGARQNEGESFAIMNIRGLPLLTGSGHATDNNRDPHVWLDPLRVRDHIVPALTDQLLALDPSGRQDYARNAKQFTRELSAVDNDIRDLLAKAGASGYIAFHSSWHYFAQRYGLIERGLVEEAPGEEPTAADVAMVVLAARRAGIKTILIEPQLSARVAEAIADGFGGKTTLVDPLGSPSVDDRKTYAELMRFNATAFAEALGPEVPR